MKNPCEDGNMLNVDCISVNMLEVIACYSSAMLPLKKTGKRLHGILSIVFCYCRYLKTSLIIKKT